ncbi:hypothetical protein RJ639_004457 [Escallonia herrerae]|uniref:CCHC-type domain-containing protein n=1 Tax=Escallonia herrerae TaxID=1293975 RepID=A0AA88W3K4_9ASTE|nr:hypothetical protein RJ639_004457 [Escallonia herrerae]
MIAKNFKKFMRFRRNGGRRQQNANNEEKLCYKCHKPGHMKMDCPIYKREKKERRDVWERVKRRQLSKKENKEKEKTMNAENTPTWSDFDSKAPLRKLHCGKQNPGSTNSENLSSYVVNLHSYVVHSAY